MRRESNWTSRARRNIVDILPGLKPRGFRLAGGLCRQRHGGFLVHRARFRVPSVGDNGQSGRQYVRCCHYVGIFFESALDARKACLGLAVVFADVLALRALLTGMVGVDGDEPAPASVDFVFQQGAELRPALVEVEAFGVADGTAVGFLFEGGRFNVAGVFEEVAESLV